MLSPKMILIGGDENQYKLLAIHMEMSGFDLLYAPNVVTGSCMIEVNKPELIILDVGLPVSSDWESCKRLREISTAPIIILSDRKDEADVLQAFKLGIDDYLRKPYSPAELIARAGAIIRRSAKE